MKILGISEDEEFPYRNGLILIDSKTIEALLRTQFPYRNGLILIFGYNR
jgi:hypothetical protein